MKHIFLRVIAIIFFSMLGVRFALAGPWSIAAFEGADTGTAVAPSGSTQRSLIDDFTRNHRYETRFRSEVGHFWGQGYAPSDDNGLHRVGTSRCYVQSTPPTILSNSHSLIPGAGNSLADYDNSTTTSASGVTDFNDAATNSAAGAEDDVGHARCWFNTGDSDFGRLYIYQGEAGDNTPATIRDGWLPVTGTGPNIVESNGFDATDGTGEVASTTLPRGWTISGSVTHSYTVATSSENTGVTYTQTATGAGGETRQTITSAKPLTNYRFTGRVKSSGAADCTLSIEDPVTTVVGSVANTLTATFETISLIITTDADPSGLNIVLEVTGIGDTCEWATVTGHELSGDPISSTYSPILYSNFDDSGPTACATDCLDVNSLDVIPPGPGWAGIVTGWARVELASIGLAGCIVEVAGLNTEVFQTNQFSATPAAPGLTIENSVPILYTIPNIVAGTLQMDITNGASCSYEASSLSITLLPPGQ